MKRDASLRLDQERRNSIFRLRLCLLLALLPPLVAAYRLRDWLPSEGTKIAVSPDGRFLASIYRARRRRSKWEGHLDVRRLPMGDCWMLKQETSRPTSIAFTPQSDLLAVGHFDGRIDIWDLNSRGRRAVFWVTDLQITHLAYSNEGDRLVAIGRMGAAIFQMDAETGDVIDRLATPVRFAEAVARNQRLALAPVVYPPTRVAIYEFQRDNLEHSMTLRGGRAPVAWSADGRRLAAKVGSTVQLWDFAEREVAQVIRMDGGRVNGLATSPRTNTLAVAWRVPTTQPSSDPKSKVTLWDLDSGSPLATVATGLLVRQLTFTPDGRQLAGIGRDGKTRLWDVATGRLHSEFSPHQSTAFTFRMLLVSILLWCGVWFWSGICRQAGSAWDVGLVSALAVVVLVVRVREVGHQPLAHALMYAAVGNLVCLFTLFVMLGSCRWSLRVPAVLVTGALLWMVAFVAGDAATVFSSSLSGSTIGLPCWLLLLAMLRGYGWRVVQVGSNVPVVEMPARQFPLRDVLLSMGAAGLFFAVARGVSPREVPPAAMSFLLVNCGLSIVIAAGGVFATLGRRPMAYLAVTAMAALASVWSLSSLFHKRIVPVMPGGRLPQWWFETLGGVLFVTVICSGLLMRLYGYRLQTMKSVSGTSSNTRSLWYRH